MKNLIKIVLIVILTLPFLYQCSEDADPVPGSGQGDTTNQNPTNTELLMKRWVVDEAYVNTTTPDGSSKGLEIEFKDRGSYVLYKKDRTTFNGTWEFYDKETKIAIDKGGKFEQNWRVLELSKQKLDVKFTSPFTYQPAQWIMIEKK